MKDKKQGIFARFLSFLRILPVFREILAFLAVFKLTIFEKRYQIANRMEALSNFDLFTEWLIFNIGVNGLLFYVVALFFIDSSLSPLYILGFGILRYVFLDLFDGTIMKIVITHGNSLVRAAQQNKKS